MQPLPFEEMIDPETGRMQPRKVDVDGEGYECARRYMIRLERSDFEDPARLAAPGRGGEHEARAVPAALRLPGRAGCVKRARLRAGYRAADNSTGCPCGVCR